MCVCVCVCVCVYVFVYVCDLNYFSEYKIDYLIFY